MRLFACVCMVVALTGSGGCTNEMCVCSESPTVAKTYQGPTVVREVARNQQGEDLAEVQLKLPARMNASLCVC